ncbi:MAG: hypothetical protein AAGG51_10910 [Cyanobacteria bacterium P01_G01_bin.54]
MAIIALKAWYLEQYEPIREIIKRPHDLRLSRNSLLKTGLRADFLNAIDEIQSSTWFERYLAGETIEFYIEGSGGYAIANIDLLSQEIYFTKQDVPALLDPVIFLSPQQNYEPAREAIATVLEKTLPKINKRSRTPLTLEVAQRSPKEPLRLGRHKLRQIEKSLLFIADITAIGSQDQTSLLSPLVSVELGYAIHAKRSGQILLLNMERDLGSAPYDLPGYQYLTFANTAGLQETLPELLKAQLQRLSVFL